MAGDVDSIAVLRLRDDGNPRGWSSGVALQIGAGPASLLLETLFKTFIFVGFEQHPNKLKPQMGWSELGFKFGSHTAHMHTHTCTQHSSFSDLRDGFELLLRQRSAGTLNPWITHISVNYSHIYWGDRGKGTNTSSLPPVSSLPMTNRKEHLLSAPGFLHWFSVWWPFTYDQTRTEPLFLTAALRGSQLPSLPPHGSYLNAQGLLQFFSSLSFSFTPLHLRICREDWEITLSL